MVRKNVGDILGKGAGFRDELRERFKAGLGA